MFFNFTDYSNNTESNESSNWFKDFAEKRFGTDKKKSKGWAWWQVLLLTILIMFLYFFFALPSLSPQSKDFYTSIILGFIVYWVLYAVLGKRLKSFKSLKVSFGIVIAAILLPILLELIASPFFFSKQYASLINVEDGDFAEDVDHINIKQVPIVDREGARVIGEKELGSVGGDIVSQFTISQKYTQVNIDEKPIRVTPLQYYDLIKYFSNFQEGIQHYVSVDMHNQDGDLVKLDEPIYYSESDIFLRDLDRHIRFQYPFYILGNTEFETDDNGKAWYVTPHLYKPIFFFGGIETKGVILTDAHSGESHYYKMKDVPAWVDRVNPSDVVIQQLDYYGKYKDGFWNSVISQRNVTSTTTGYNYISLGSDIYLTTGVTSVRADESNLGFYYVNLRTKETKFFQVPSATETAAMQSAKGKVQEKNYDPTFPVILNIGGRPVYFMSLKDQSKTAKLFALVDAQQFTDVIIGNTVEETLTNYYEQNPNVISEQSSLIEDLEETVTVKDVSFLVEEGNTVYYFTVKENDYIYKADPQELDPGIAFLEEGDKLKVITTNVVSEDEETKETKDNKVKVKVVSKLGYIG